MDVSGWIVADWGLFVQRLLVRSSFYIQIDPGTSITLVESYAQPFPSLNVVNVVWVRRAEILSTACMVQGGAVRACMMQEVVAHHPPPAMGVPC